MSEPVTHIPAQPGWYLTEIVRVNDEGDAALARHPVLAWDPGDGDTYILVGSRRPAWYSGHQPRHRTLFLGIYHKTYATEPDHSDVFEDYGLFAVPLPESMDWDGVEEE